MKRSQRIILVLPISLSLGLACGCHTTAPMSTWNLPKHQNSELNPASAHLPLGRVAFAPIQGPAQVSERLELAINQSLPRGSQHLAVVYPAGTPDRAIAAGLRTGMPIAKPVSHRMNAGPETSTTESMEVTPMEAARNRGAQLIVHGNIEMADLGDPAESNKSFAHPNSPGAAMAAASRASNAKDERLVVTWEAYDVASGQFVNASTMSLSRSQIEKSYPDLNSVKDPSERLIIGASREAWAQFAPSVGKQDVTLQRPYWSWGAKQVREGNTLASEGLWQMAEYQWQGAVKDHPKNKSAWHNLAISSVAQEDFELARVRLSKAKSWIPSKQYEKTELWIDRQQKIYHRAFGLADREGGWLTPDPPTAPPASEVSTVEPVEIEDLPWWTSIPFTKPPGWTWKAWLTQPLP